MDKFDIGFPDETKEQYIRRIINQLWKLIPMRENNEDWITHLNTLIEEISGLVEIFKSKPEGLALLSKLEGLTSEVCDDFMIYRRAVFKCIDLVGQVVRDE